MFAGGGALQRTGPFSNFLEPRYTTRTSSNAHKRGPAGCLMSSPRPPHMPPLSQMPSLTFINQKILSWIPFLVPSWPSLSYSPSPPTLRASSPMSAALPSLPSRRDALLERGALLDRARRPGQDDRHEGLQIHQGAPARPGGPGEVRRRRDLHAAPRPPPGARSHSWVCRSRPAGATRRCTSRSSPLRSPTSSSSRSAKASGSQTPCCMSCLFRWCRVARPRPPRATPGKGSLDRIPGLRP